MKEILMCEFVNVCGKLCETIGLKEGPNISSRTSSTSGVGGCEGTTTREMVKERRGGGRLIEYEEEKTTVFFVFFKI